MRVDLNTTVKVCFTSMEAEMIVQELGDVFNVKGSSTLFIARGLHHILRRYLEANKTESAKVFFSEKKCERLETELRPILARSEDHQFMKIKYLLRLLSEHVNLGRMTLADVVKGK